MCIIILDSIHFILKAEKILKREGFDNFDIIPVPKEIHTNCGSAIKINKKDKKTVIKILKENRLNLRLFCYDEKLNFYIEEEI